VDALRLAQRRAISTNVVGEVIGEPRDALLMSGTLLLLRLRRLPCGLEVGGGIGSRQQFRL
jgi:hypothetical protein